MDGPWHLGVVQITSDVERLDTDDYPIEICSGVNEKSDRKWLIYIDF